MTGPPPNADFTIAWFCPSRLELVVAREMFDYAYGKHPQTLHPFDTNAYELGKIGRNNVVIVCLYSAPAPTTDLPEKDRYSTAETVYKQMKATFVSLRVGLFVAVGSGIPYGLNDIRLGDVVVGTPDREFWGVVGLALESASGSASSALDSGRMNLLSTKEGYSHLLTTATHALAADLTLGVPSKITSYLSKMFEWYPEKRAVYAYPGAADDVFVRTEYKCGFHHSSNKQTAIPQPARADCTRPVVHSGTIAVTNKPVTDVRVRDRWSESLGIKGLLSISGAGRLDRTQIPMLFVCGVGDYADSCGDGRWSGYAAATAAAYAKELLNTLAALPLDDRGYTPVY
ncbi:hypothetical protein BDW72DRAFT_197701 [Aspergillus terricola var. indicus]